MDDGYDIATIGELGGVSPCCAPCAGRPMGDLMSEDGPLSFTTPEKRLRIVIAGSVLVGGLLVLLAQRLTR